MIQTRLFSAALILNLGHQMGCVIFTPQTLCAPRNNPHCPLIGGRAGDRASLDVFEKIKISSLPGLESRIVQPVA